MPLLRVKIRADQNEPFPELMIFLIIFHFMNLYKSGSRILIQLEFKNVDPVAARQSVRRYLSTAERTSRFGN